MSRYDKNSFLEDDLHEHPRSAPGAQRKPRRKGGLPIAAVIAIDVAVAALALFVFALFYFLIPRDLSGNTVSLPTPPKTAAQSAPDAQASADETDGQSASVSPPEVADASDFGALYPGKFTDGEVNQTANSYQSANVNVAWEKRTIDGINCYIADVYVRNLECFRTAFAQDTFGYEDHTYVIAQQKGAVIAVNGDNCVDNHGPVVRNGEMQRDKPYTADVLVLGWDGVMTTYFPDEFDIGKVRAEGAWQVWTFGPMLLKDGQPMTKFNSSVKPANPRTAVGYYAPGHYCFVVVDGRPPQPTNGMTMTQLSQLFASLGCTGAYNLDGGRTTEMAFMGELINEPFDNGRPTSDILYIADIAGE